VLKAAGHRVTLRATTGPRTAAAIARECIQSGADLILAAGGDGTINEVMNGMVHSNVPLGILPAGTANVLAVELGAGTRMAKVASQLSNYMPVRIAVGEFENTSEKRHFILMAGVGLDAMIVYDLDTNLKSALGKIAYWVAGFGQLGKKLPEFDVRIDGHQVRCSFALASRVRNYGGDLWIARNACLFSDNFEIVLFEGTDTLPYLRYLVSILTNRLLGTRGVTVTRAQQIELSCADDPRIYVQLDGEHVGLLPARLTLLPKALTLLVPEAYRKNHLRANG
jgi:YegS/Rv2252/BmrU family lipid kinase